MNSKKHIVSFHLIDFGLFVSEQNSVDIFKLLRDSYRFSMLMRQTFYDILLKEEVSFKIQMSCRFVFERSYALKPFAEKPFITYI